MNAITGAIGLDANLARRAQQAGIATTFTSFWGETVTVSAEVLAEALAAMGPNTDVSATLPVVLTQGTATQVLMAQVGDWKLRGDGDTADVAARGHGATAPLPDTLPSGYYVLQAGDTERLVIVAPAQCWLPDGLRSGERWWGITAQMYALRSERSWGIGDFSDLAQLAATAAAQGAAFVGVSPLHALRPDCGDAASPYSPSSRLALNVLHIDVAAVPEFLQCADTQRLCADSGFRQRLAAVQASATVDYPEVVALKEAALSKLWHCFAHTHWHPRSERGTAFDDFMQAHRSTLGLHALYEAIQLTLQAQDAAVWGWPAWPESLRDPLGAGALAFAQEHADRVAYRFWLQWLAHEQLAQVSARARALMPLGLYCDLAVGASNGGAENWVEPGLYAHGMNVGAPPDPLSHKGQDWGLPPVNPTALAAARFRPFRALLGAVMRYAGALRMDHAMALMRLYWTSPAGGTYVQYPLEAMLAVLAVESYRHQCMVIGEDLGNVAPRMREAMAEHAMLSYKPLIFERLSDGAFRPPSQWQAKALAVVSTHDLPTLAGFWAADDVAVHQSLGWLNADDAHVRSLLARAQDRTHLLAALHVAGLLPDGVTVDSQSAPEMTPTLAAAVHAFLARTPCQLVGVQLEDLTGQREQPNVPGTTDDLHPNWRRRMVTPLELLPQHPFFISIAAAVRAERRRTTPLAAAMLPALDTADIPLATYRVQLHGGFTFAQATAAVPYLQALGVSHLYTSPYLQAAPGSTHGYDVVDPTQLNAEIGTEEDHAALCAALFQHGMGHMLDIVPNHMGVEGAANPWWQEVLEHGEASPHAATFDIEWQPANPQTGPRVLLPVLGDHYGKLLEAGELQLRFDAATGRIQVTYWNHRFPLDPRSYAAALATVPPPVAGTDVDVQALAEVQSLIDAFAALPGHHACDEAQRCARLRDTTLLQQRLAQAAAAHAWVQPWIDACLARVNGTPGDGASMDLLDGLLLQQAYRLADWRVAGDDINYRRFFDINALAAIRMEEPAVFDAVHALPFRWLAEGSVTGLRIDHPDGLADPARYFERLQQRYAALQHAQGREPQALYVVVEKIMADHEPLPADWRVHGGTGYRFSTLVNGLFIDADAQERFDALYTAFTGDTQPFEEAAYECKRLIIETALFSDLGWLVETLSRITRADRTVCDFTRNQLRVALTEVAAQFPVYRTYVVPGGAPASDVDRQHIDWAISAARRRLGTAEGGLLAYLQSVLLGEPGAEVALRAHFVRRWQQFTAPVMAKSIEDTLFYRYVRLVSLNDVGAEPQRFGISTAAFHQANLQRARHLPHGMLATSTHDSKRSEDVRARLNVLSELPGEWQATVKELQAAAERFQTEVDGAPAPSSRDLWGLYQALVGIWPAEGGDPQDRARLVERVQRYMVKAMREAKQASNWLFPNDAYEGAMSSYIEKALATDRFVGVLEGFVRRIAPYGYRNSLCQLALKLTVPGVPDIYQGCEAWNFSLVDPDNRRPVDFAALAASLASVQTMYAQGRWPDAAQWQSLLGGQSRAMPAAVKQLVTWRLLRLRERYRAVFRDGLYLPLAVEGSANAHAIAFARIHDGVAVVVVCTRLMARWEIEYPSGWGDTCVNFGEAHPAIARQSSWFDACTGQVRDGASHLSLRELLGSTGMGSTSLPFAVLAAKNHIE